MSREQLALFGAAPGNGVAQTLTEALAALGYTHRAPRASAPQSHREVVDAAGRVVFTGDCWDAWAWLAAGRPAR